MSAPLRQLRHLSILLLALALHWPGAGRPEVYSVLGQQLESLAELLRLATRPGGARRVLLNGQPIRATLATSHDTPARIHRRLLRRLQPWQPANPTALAGLRQPLWIDGRDWSVMGAVNLETDADDAPGDWLVILLPGERPDEHTVWTLEFAPGGFRALLRASSAPQVPGPPLAGFRPPLGGRRIFSLSEYSDHGEGHVQGFESPGTVASVADYYRRTLPDGVATLGHSGEDPGVILHVRQPDHRLTVHISDTDDGRVLTVVQRRPGRG